MIVVLLICALNIPQEECNERTAKNMIVMPQQPIVCELPMDPEDVEKLFREGQEYVKIVCHEGRRI